jgi:hypothetical protein
LGDSAAAGPGEKHGIRSVASRIFQPGPSIDLLGWSPYGNTYTRTEKCVYSKGSLYYECNLWFIKGSGRCRSGFGWKKTSELGVSARVWVKQMVQAGEAATH